MNTVVLIPSLNPDENLVTLIKNLKTENFKAIVVVNDGSDSDHLSYFDRVGDICTVIGYEKNRGKGAALKTGIEYIKKNIPDCVGIVTADSDGQHSVTDIKRISDELSADKNELILGVRNFDSGNVPPKSEYGNKITRSFFKFLYGVKITDTQTGLRGIPACLFDWALALDGDRFEYETNMLIATKNNGTAIKELEIETIYENKNEGTHFRPVHDSIKIYSTLLGQFIKYSFSSLLCVLIDLGIYTLLSKLVFNTYDESSKIFASTAIARAVSSLVNYCVNRNGVFKNKSNVGSSLVKYYILCILQALASYLLVFVIHSYVLWFIDDVFVKVIVDVCLFFASYFIQQKWVFKSKKVK